MDPPEKYTFGASPPGTSLPPRSLLPSLFQSLSQPKSETLTATSPASSSSTTPRVVDTSATPPGMGNRQNLSQDQSTLDIGSPFVAQEDNGLTSLLSADSSVILDLVDQLRRKGIRNDIPLPHIIVVGDQSSGKSSVLEAISRLNFPRGQGLCTTFATELALRRKSTARINARIEPASTRPQEERENLLAWKPDSTDLADFDEIITSAKDKIKAQNPGSPASYSQDVLHIEASGPDYPQLTLVDLPGLIKSKNKNQTDEDVVRVDQLVKTYMTDPASIILAVVSAEVDQATQAALSLAHKYDSTGDRTIGVITKPDRAEENSHKEFEYIECARNQVQSLKHGWFVLKNRDYQSGKLSADERDAAELEFFATSNWNAIPSSQLGATALKEQLSTLLDSEIRQALPSIVNNIQTTLANYKSEINRLGLPRNSVEQQKFYLDDIAGKFEDIVKQSVNGAYLDHGFFDKVDSNEPRKLRAHIQRFHREFADRLPSNGLTALGANGPNDHFISISARDFETDPSLLVEVARIHEESRGASIDGIVDRNHLLSILFRKAAGQWHGIADAYLKNVIGVVRQHLQIVAQHIAGTRTARNLQAHIIDDAITAKELELESKLAELFAPYQDWYPSTFNPAFAEGHRLLHHGADGTVQATQLGTVEFEYVRAIKEMILFYQVALGTFIDNVVILGTEMVLLKDLKNLFNSRTVSFLSNDSLQMLAAESSDDQRKRCEYDRKVVEFTDAMRICRSVASATYHSPGSVPGLESSVNTLSPSSTGPRTPVDRVKNVASSRGSPSPRARYLKVAPQPLHVRSTSVNSISDEDF